MLVNAVLALLEERLDTENVYTLAAGLGRGEVDYAALETENVAAVLGLVGEAREVVLGVDEHVLVAGLEGAGGVGGGDYDEEEQREVRGGAGAMVGNGAVGGSGWE